MKISVITAAYNSEATIGYTLESFLSQTYADAELLVVDGASRDGTEDVVRSFRNDRIRFISEADRGIFDAMNKGLRLASGDAVGFLNSDDRFHDADVLADVASAFSGIDIVFGNLDFVSDHESSTVVRKWQGSPYVKGAFKKGWMPAHPTFYVRKAVASAVGFFDTSYRVSADYDWMMRALELNDFRCRFLERVFVDMAIGGASTSGFSSYWNGNRESLRARQKWLGAGVVDMALMTKPLRKALQFVIK